MQYTDLNSNLRTRQGNIEEYSTYIKAIFNSIHNIINTNRGELPSNPEFGSNIKNFLFDNFTPSTNLLIKEDILYSLEKWEPRIKVVNILITKQEEYNRLTASIIFNIIDSEEEFSTTLVIK